MRFPKHPLTINGGCNCGSIRYKVNVPAFEDRPVLPYCDENARDDKERIPTVFVDHCNDCRRASGALLPVWLICAISFVEFSINSTWTPAAELLKKEDLEIQKTPPFKLYHSSEPSFRGFCENCGTMLCYRSRTGFPDGWPDMVDILVGTVDRVDLEKEWMKPQRELWWDMGIPWIQELARDGTVKEDTPRHPLWKVNIQVPSS